MVIEGIVLLVSAATPFAFHVPEAVRVIGHSYLSSEALTLPFVVALGALLTGLNLPFPNMATRVTSQGVDAEAIDKSVTFMTGCTLVMP